MPVFAVFYQFFPLSRQNTFCHVAKTQPSLHALADGN